VLGFSSSPHMGGEGGGGRTTPSKKAQTPFPAFKR